MSLAIVAGLIVIGLAISFRELNRYVDSRAVASRITAADVQPFSPIAAIAKFHLPVSQRKYEKQLPVLLDAIARSLYSGAGFLQGIREASNTLEGPVAQDLRQVVYEVDLGANLEDALLHWSTRVGYQSVRVTVSAMTLALNTGGNQSQAVDSASAAVRRTLEALAIVHTHSTEARVSAVVVGIMPWLVALPFIILSRAGRHFMLETVYGLCCLAIGAMFDVLGVLWMRALIKRALA